MSRYELVPERERLRQAVQWMSDLGDHSAHAVEEASRRFDLSPLDEEFLLRYFVWKTADGSAAPGSPS